MKTPTITGPKLLNPQVFRLIRNEDETGVFGTGVVLDGIIFPSGQCVVMWRGAAPAITVWQSFDAFKRIHIDSHPNNKTEVIWLIVEDPEKEQDHGPTVPSIKPIEYG